MTDAQNEVFDPAEVQALHRRILAAKDRGDEPTPEDKAMAARVNASRYAMFDRPWRSDDD
jgi:hypothetical protein